MRRRIGVLYDYPSHRQTAVGLPFIKEAVYGGEKRSVTGYTMSEILAVSGKKSRRAKKEGILFID